MMPALPPVLALPTWPSQPVQQKALSPAKINLFLHITGRRADGYHLLQSLFCPLAWGDTVELTLQPVQPTAAGLGAILPPPVPTHAPTHVGPGWVFSRSGGLMHIAPERDLSWRAALALVQALPRPPQPMHLHIHVHKRIPEQAGLGGGSSNAATVLVLLNQALGGPLGLPGLAALALPLGADVPFFLHSSPAWVEGIGEHIQPVALPAAWALVYKPPMACPTAAVFADPGLVRNSPPLVWPFAREGGQGQAVSGLAPGCAALGSHALGWTALGPWLQGQTRNALQAVVAQTVGGWQKAHTAFAALCMAHEPVLVRMSGSGSAMFALFESEAACQQALLACASQGLQAECVACVS